MEQIMYKISEAHKREAVKRGLLYVCILCLLMGIISLLIYVTLRNDIFEEIDDLRIGELELMEREIHSEIENVSTYVSHLSRFPQTARAFGGDTMAIYDTQYTMKSISEYNKCMDQLRLIDVEGNEVVRVDTDDQMNTEIVPDEDLQNKSDRSYFSESMEAEKGQVYISAMDLNVEKGEIQYPYNPVLRISMPVMSGDSKLGIVIVNYKARALYDLIESLNKSHSIQWYLVEENGFYLHGPSENEAFGFAMVERNKTGLFSDYSNAWSEMQKRESGKIVVDKAWLFFKRVRPVSSDINFAADRNWYLITQMPYSAIQKELQHLDLGLQIGNVLLLPVFVILAWMLGNSQVKTKYYKIELEKQARIDPLTGLYNRRHINELLIYNTDLATRQKGDLSLVYIDLNDLKEYNDTYGHDMGDIMIQSAAKAMTDNVRKTDIVARMGGDEFMIILPDCSLDQLNTIMERISATFGKAGQKHLNKPWTMSWGSSKWNSQGDTIADFINRADEEMYANKEEYKEECKMQVTER